VTQLIRNAPWLAREQADTPPTPLERKVTVPNDHRRTIEVTASRPSRFSRLRVVYPDHAPHPAYDAVLARELLGRTGEFPDSKRGLVALLTEYRHALHALALQLECRERPDQHDSGASPPPPATTRPHLRPFPQQASTHDDAQRAPHGACAPYHQDDTGPHQPA